MSSEQGDARILEIDVGGFLGGGGRGHMGPEVYLEGLGRGDASKYRVMNLDVFKGP